MGRSKNNGKIDDEDLFSEASMKDGRRNMVVNREK